MGVQTIEAEQSALEVAHKDKYRPAKVILILDMRHLVGHLRSLLTASCSMWTFRSSLVKPGPANTKHFTTSQLMCLTTAFMACTGHWHRGLRIGMYKNEDSFAVLCSYPCGSIKASEDPALNLKINCHDVPGDPVKDASAYTLSCLHLQFLIARGLYQPHSLESYDRKDLPDPETFCMLCQILQLQHLVFWEGLFLPWLFEWL